MGVVTVERNMKLKEKRYIGQHELMLYKPISSETKNTKRVVSGGLQTVSPHQLLASAAAQQGHLQGLNGAQHQYGVPAQYVDPAYMQSYLPTAAGQSALYAPQLAAAAAAAGAAGVYSLPPPGLQVPAAAGALPPPALQLPTAAADLQPAGATAADDPTAAAAAGLLPPYAQMMLQAAAQPQQPVMLVSGSGAPLLQQQGGLPPPPAVANPAPGGSSVYPAGYGLLSPAASVSDMSLMSAVSAAPLWQTGGALSLSHQPAQLSPLCGSFAMGRCLVSPQVAEFPRTLVSSPSFGARHSGRSRNTTPRSALLKHLHDRKMWETPTPANKIDLPFDEEKRRWLEIGPPLSKLAGHVVEFAFDKDGSRYLQFTFSDASEAEKQMIADELLACATDPIDDMFSNYVIQKMFQFGTEEIVVRLMAMIKGKVVQRSVQQFACRVIQTAVEFVSDKRKDSIINELRGHELMLIVHPQGNHVLQKCIECAPKKVEFLLQSVLGQVNALATHSFACRVVQRLIEHFSSSEHIRALRDELLLNVEDMVDHAYGNYVVQELIKQGPEPERKNLIMRLTSAQLIYQCSQSKYASNVIEMCFAMGAPAEQERIMNQALSLTNDQLLGIINSNFGNYVLQKFLLFNGWQQKQLIARVLPLRQRTYGNSHAGHFYAAIQRLSENGDQNNNKEQESTGGSVASAGE